jgi:hypothetical protein
VITPHLFGLITSDAHANGTVYVYDDYPAATLWFHMTYADEAVDVQPDPDPRYDQVIGPYADRWTALAETMHRNHPHRAHLYLRHTYRDLEEPFFLPDHGPPMWPMWHSAMVPT